MWEYKASATLLWDARCSVGGYRFSTCTFPNRPLQDSKVLFFFFSFSELQVLGRRSIGRVSVLPLFFPLFFFSSSLSSLSLSVLRSRVGEGIICPPLLIVFTRARSYFIHAIVNDKPACFHPYQLLFSHTSCLWIMNVAFVIYFQMRENQMLQNFNYYFFFFYYIEINLRYA